MKCTALYPVKIKGKLYKAGAIFECTQKEYEGLNANGASCKIVEKDAVVPPKSGGTTAKK